MHILITVNAAWNVLHFRQALIVALIADGHRVTVLAPRDHSVTALEGLGIPGIDMLLMFAPVGILFRISPRWAW